MFAAIWELRTATWPSLCSLTLLGDRVEGALSQEGASTTPVSKGFGGIFTRLCCLYFTIYSYHWRNNAISTPTITNKSLGRGSFITGRSIQNTRIERLWRDVYQIVLSIFYDLFLSLAEQCYLNTDNHEHLFCLHFVYKPIINEMLHKFSRSWVNYKIRTARNKTPMQLFIMRMKQVASEHGVVASEYFESLNVESV